MGVRRSCQSPIAAILVLPSPPQLLSVCALCFCSRFCVCVRVCVLSSMIGQQTSSTNDAHKPFFLFGI